MKTLALKKRFKFLILILIYIFNSNLVKSQNDPSWLMEAWRTEQYPANVYITGFAQDGKNKNETIADATERIKDLARANLTESILASVQSVSDSYSQSILQGDSESIKETFKSQTKVSTDMKINGIKVESYIKNDIIYGFAYANKFEIIGYYKANLNMLVQQIEGFINTATELENSNEKKKAKDEFNKALPIFTEVKEAQGILSAVDKDISEDDLKMQQTMKLYNEIVQANARLAQGIMVYLVTDEDLFGEKINTIENGLKAILAVNECSFVTDENKADWKVFVMQNQENIIFQIKFILAM